MVSGVPIHPDNLEALIEQHFPFIIRTVSNVTGRYVSIENDDEFSIALSAFAEAVNRYDEQRGNFFTFAALVIQSRVKTYLDQQHHHASEVSLEELYENGQDFEDGSNSDTNLELHEEIIIFQCELRLFGLSLETLADEAPHHHDTRITAIHTAQKASTEPRIVKLTYQKHKLPIREVSRFCDVTEKIVKHSKSFILAVMIIFVKKLPNLICWIKEARCPHVL